MALDKNGNIKKCGIFKSCNRRAVSRQGYSGLWFWCKNCDTYIKQ